MSDPDPWKLTPRTSKRADDPEGQEFADMFAQELLDTISAAIRNRPRSLQREIGPSELGIPCDRALLHKLAEDDEPRDRGPAWKPEVGTALHDMMERLFSTDEKVEDGWLTENRVLVGDVGGTGITGSADLYNGGTVVDWKFVGPSMLKKYKASGPGEQYRGQAHLYGRGFRTLGYAVELVMIAFVPRDGELEDSFFWWERFDPDHAEEVLARANKLFRLQEALGADKAAELFPACQDPWCPWCGTGKAWGGPSALTMDTSL